MLIKRQSFEISHRRKSHKRKRSDRLYETKTYPGFKSTLSNFKSILSPVLIGLLLMCILINVNFASEIEKTRGNENISAGVGDNVSLNTYVTEFWNNENQSHIRSSLQEPSKETKGAEQNLSIDSENRVASFPKNIIKQHSGLENMQLLQTEIEKADEEQVKVLNRDTTDSKAPALKSISLKLKPSLDAKTIKRQKLIRNENRFSRLLKVFPKTGNHQNKYAATKNFNSSPETPSKEIIYKSQETESIETIIDTSVNANEAKIGNASIELIFPIVYKEILADGHAEYKVGNADSVPISLTRNKEILIGKEGKSKIYYSKTLLSFGLMAEDQPHPYAYQSPPQDGKATYYRKLYVWENTRVANSNKNKQQKEFKNSPGKQNYKLEVSEIIKDISQEVGNGRDFQEKNTYLEKIKTDVNVMKNVETESKANTTNLVGNSKSFKFLSVIDIKDKLNVSTNRGEYKSYESETKFPSKEKSNIKQLSRETGNDVPLEARKVISKGFNVSKLPRSIKYGASKTSDGMANQDLSAAIVGTVNEPIPCHLTKVNTNIVGNAVPQYMPDIIALYDKDFVKHIVRLKEENLSDTSPYEPKTSNIKEFPVGIANFFTQSTAIKDNVLKEPPNKHFRNSRTTLFETTQTVGNAVTELPTELKAKEAQQAGSKHHDPHEMKYFENQIKTPNSIPSEIDTASWQLKPHTIESGTQYSETINNNTNTVFQLHEAEDTAQPIEFGKWFKSPLGSKNKTLDKIEHLSGKINTALTAVNAVPNILKQTKYIRSPRQVQTDVNAAVNPIKCTSFTANCTLICDTGGLSHIDIDLERLQDNCVYKDLTLELRNCVFDDGIMKASLLNGFYSLQELQIINCNLITIQEGAFRGTGVKKLQTLKFINNSITLLTATTFVGLTVLKHFELSQHVVGDNSLGSNFLTPMAPTLTNVKIMQTSDNNAIVDPSAWFLGPDLVALYTVELENNNLQGILEAVTFKSLVAVGTLNLQKCSLDTIDIRPFELVMDSLNNLNLNDNYLITLDPMFLEHLKENQVSLSAVGNVWQCDCDHSALIEYLKNVKENQYINMEEFSCANPDEWKQINMVYVTLKCEAETTTIISSEELDTASSQKTEKVEPTIKSTTELATSPITVTLDTTLSQCTEETEPTWQSTTEVVTAQTTLTLDTTISQNTEATKTSEVVTSSATVALDTTPSENTGDTDLTSKSTREVAKVFSLLFSVCLFISIYIANILILQ